MIKIIYRRKQFRACLQFQRVGVHEDHGGKHGSGQAYMISSRDLTLGPQARGKQKINWEPVNF